MHNTTIIPFKPAKEAPKSHRSAMETLIFTAEQIGNWRIPPFQRPVSINAKVRAMAEEVKLNGGVINGVITLGTVKGEHATYIVDGQHRLEGYRISGLPEFIADVRFVTFNTMAEMAEEFVILNSSLVKMRPDDILRGLEYSIKALQTIRKECPFVGYDQIRRGTTSPILGMSLLLRSWSGAHKETPVSSQQQTAASIAESMDTDNVENLIQFLTTVHAAWGRDPEYARLWSGINLGLCMWLWLRLVKDLERTGVKRYVKLNIKQFRAAMMGLSADSQYLDWLQGRSMGDRDRNPCYVRIKKIMLARLRSEAPGMKIKFPQPAWASG